MLGAKPLVMRKPDCNQLTYYFIPVIKYVPTCISQKLRWLAAIAKLKQLFVVVILIATTNLGIGQWKINLFFIFT